MGLSADHAARAASAGHAASAEESARALKRGSLVAFPTETVYGLGADATNADAIARLYAAKGRPPNHPVIVHIPNAAAMPAWARQIPAYANALAAKFWPGPMTLVLSRTELAKDFITGGQNTVGLRVPNHPVALELLAHFAELGGQGVAAPSANRFGAVSPTTAAAVREELSAALKPEDLILDGGTSEVGLESTIIDCTGEAPKILRPGAITAAMIQQVTGLSLAEPDQKMRVSGSLESHYAP
ncbi:MAG: threonylcarbamoyl-AMP synthase, partial [Actinobacteria bacterium]|nr:threonylcarbamoyl-AMP synthase [Actinomycetota bacterium]